MASTEKLPSGKYRGVYYDSAKKKQHTPARDRLKDARADAVEAEAKARRKASSDKGTLPGHTTWSEWYPIWWENRDVEPTTEDVEGRILRNHLVPHWGEEELAKIQKADIQAWVNSLAKRPAMSGSYVRRIYTVFRSSITAAVAKEVLGASPCVGVKIPPRRVTGGPERTYERDELDRAWSHLRYRNRWALEFIAETGLRPSEFAGLHRHRIDRKTGWLTVINTYDHVAKRIKSYPKDDDERHVPLSSRALAMLDEWDELFPSASTSCGIPHQHGKCKSDLQWRNERGGPMITTTMYTQWTKAQRRAKLEAPGRVYDLRHYFGSRLAEAGIDPWEIARLMGHSSLDQSTPYMHRIASARRRILAALGDVQADPTHGEGGSDEREPAA